MMQEQVDIIEVLDVFGRNLQANLHTACVARVEAVKQKTIDCQPVINRVVNGKEIQLPIFADVPPIFMHGGSSSITMPIAPGDYCLLIFSERCFDRWYDGQDLKPPAEMRMHDYSDAFALVGLHNKSGALTIPQETTIKGVTRMGVDNPTDFMALANKVMTELTNIQAMLITIATTFSAHTHPVAGIMSGDDEATAGAPSSLVNTYVPASVASSWVKAE